MITIPSLLSDIANKENHLEPTIKYKVGESVRFRSPIGDCTGEVLQEFTKSEFGWLLRVMVKDGQYERDIYFKEIIQTT